MGNGLQLVNVVEVDETFLGGKFHNKRKSQRIKSRCNADKHLVISICERGGNTIAMSVKDIKTKTILKIIRENVKRGSTFYTDEYGAYRGIIGDGRWPYEYNHGTVKH